MEHLVKFVLHLYFIHYLLSERDFNKTSMFLIINQNIKILMKLCLKYGKMNQFKDFIKVLCQEF